LSKLFIEAQAFEVKANIVYRDNTQLYAIGREWQGKLWKAFTSFPYQVLLHYQLD
jgi:hypothetical protein